MSAVPSGYSGIRLGCAGVVIRDPLSSIQESGHLGHEEHTVNPEPTCTVCLKAFQSTVMWWSASASRDFPWRRAGRKSYELVIAEVLLQQTRAEQVGGMFGTFIERCPDWPDLATVPIADLENLLRPLGLQKRRASSLHALAREVVQNGLPDTAADLQKLSGIGQYMARAIAAQLFDEVVAPVDTNVARVLERVFGPRTLADIRYDPALQGLALQLVPHNNPSGYLVAILDFASLVCRARAPLCNDCPVTSCRYRSSASQAARK